MSDYKEFIGIFNESPVEIVKSWLDEANGVEENGSAFTLSTIGLDGQPNSRVLLLKDIVDNQPLFFSNYLSQKGKEIEANNNGAMAFYWHKLGKQVRLRGKLTKSSREVSDQYFHSRAKESQIASLTSKQSQEIESRKLLEDEYQKNLVVYNNCEVPLPEQWGGYLLDVCEVTFFIYGEHRLNDRFQFIRQGSEWVSKRLYP